MGTVLGSGYSQVPVVSEAALASLAMTATEIKAQSEERKNSILREGKDTQTLAKRREELTGVR